MWDRIGGPNVNSEREEASKAQAQDVGSRAVHHCTGMSCPFVECDAHDGSYVCTASGIVVGVELRQTCYENSSECGWPRTHTDSRVRSVASDEHSHMFCADGASLCTTVVVDDKANTLPTSATSRLVRGKEQRRSKARPATRTQPQRDRFLATGESIIRKELCLPTSVSPASCRVPALTSVPTKGRIVERWLGDMYSCLSRTAYVLWTIFNESRNDNSMRMSTSREAFCKLCIGLVATLQRGLWHGDNEILPAVPCLHLYRRPLRSRIDAKVGSSRSHVHTPHKGASFLKCWISSTDVQSLLSCVALNAMRLELAQLERTAPAENAFASRRD